ncbi:hypothetical protein HY489_03800 [Candidatus Woesearchaeota archaeon]|nr:hypothetical protein [Candidatus Woesearchaeota archaeon]
MSQEAITEVDMEFFSKRVGPYFSWLESKIESGWQQSDSVPKDVLKEVRYMSTNMRARFILGISRQDFVKEAQRALELLELAAEAFPDEAEEVEAKAEQFCKGVVEELGIAALPEKYRASKSEPESAPGIKVELEPKVVKKVEPVKIVPVVEKKAEPKVKAAPVVAVAEPKITVKKPVKREQTVPAKVDKVKKAAPKIEQKAVAKPVKAKPEAKKAERKNGKRNFFGSMLKLLKEYW